MNSAELITADVIIIGAGAAGLMTAIRLAQLRPDLNLIVLDGAKKLGAKILISGGGRCNVTNQSVTGKDFNGGSRNAIKRVLKALTAKQTVEFFESIGVPLHAEPHGKMFPDSNKARTVLNAMIESAERAGVQLLTDQRVNSVSKNDQHFHVTCSNGEFRCQRVVLATGGKSVPKTGSDGFGYELARQLGHSILPTFPALAPMLLTGEFHQPLSGISQEVELALHANDQKPQRFRGSMLWTHFGISGPVVLDLSRHWHVAQFNCLNPKVYCRFQPDLDFQAIENQLIKWCHEIPNTTVRRQLAKLLPSRFVAAILDELSISHELSFAEFPKKNRRELAHQLCQRELPISDSRGFRYAEATAGGIPLSEIDSSTLQSRACENLFLVGEIVDVDGRLGGFNFQWAWSSGTVAARGIAASFS